MAITIIWKPASKLYRKQRRSAKSNTANTAWTPYCGDSNIETTGNPLSEVILEERR
jgi:hypothetical protein